MEYYTRITYLTLISYACGLIIFDWPLISLMFFFVLIALAYYTKTIKLYIFYQDALTITQIIITMYIFGLIHTYTYHSIIQFMNFSAQLNDGQIRLGLPLLAIYLSFQCVYYYFEFQLNNNFHHAELSWYSFLIYHSKPYVAANVFCLIQHLLTKYVFGFSYKIDHYLIYSALLMMIMGEGLRISAFFTAKSNFTHLVRYQKDPEHQLITHGVYSFFRHPSYTGFFYYCVASQIFIGNFISAIGFIFVLIKFFKQRIEDQQYMLALFFDKYLHYKSHTYILIPFLKVPSSQQILKQIMKNSNKK